MRKFWDSTFFFTLMQIFNFCVFLLGVGLIGSALYLYLIVKFANTFILSLGIIGTFILFISAYGYCCTKRSPNLLLCYELFLLLLTMFVLILAFFILYAQPDIINFLTSKMTDSHDTIAAAKMAINRNMNITKIALFVYSIVIVCLFIYYYFR